MWETEDVNTDVATQEAQRRDIDDFIENCKAVKCTPENYSQWLSEYLLQGGEITEFHLRIRFRAIGINWFKPTLPPGVPIPVLQGENELNLVVLTSPGASFSELTSLKNSPGDGGSNARVYSLHNGTASTSSPDHVPCYADIVPLLHAAAQFYYRDQEIRHLMQKYDLSLEQAMLVDAQEYIW